VGDLDDVRYLDMSDEVPAARPVSGGVVAESRDLTDDE
jgi:hypothetical protein